LSVAKQLEAVSLGELIHQAVRAAIERAVREELDAAIGAGVYERGEGRRGYRNGHRERTLSGPTGPAALTVPRATLFTEGGYGLRDLQPANHPARAAPAPPAVSRTGVVSILMVVLLPAPFRAEESEEGAMADPQVEAVERRARYRTASSTRW